MEMQKWANNIKTVEKEGINLAIIAASNHYAGFGPGTVNIFRKMLGLPDAKWEEREEEEQQQQKHISHDSKERTLSDFLSYLNNFRCAFSNSFLSSADNDIAFISLNWIGLTTALHM
jgi:hypothetical protein